MTKHEGLTYLDVSTKYLSKSDLGQYFSIAKSTASEAVNRWKSHGLVRAVGRIGKEVRWGLTEKGKKKLDYFDNNGCGNDDCWCHR